MKKRMTLLLLCLSLAAGLWLEQSVSSYAQEAAPPLTASETEAGDPDTFAGLLRSDEDLKIKVTADFIATDPESAWHDETDNFSYWILLGQGNKTLDLNGHTVELNRPSATRSGMIFIPEGASLTVEDSSHQNSGKLFAYGDLTAPGYQFAKNDVKNRRIFYVDGGRLTINGGTFEAGRSKEVWCINGRSIRNSEEEDASFFDYTNLWARYDGYIWRQNNGCAVLLNGGSASINGGRFIGRGYMTQKETYDSYGEPVFTLYHDASVRVHGGSLLINNGEFQGRGNAVPLLFDPDAQVAVYGGRFERSTLKRVEYPAIHLEPLFILDDGADCKYSQLDQNSGLVFNLDVMDQERTEVYLDGALSTWEDAKKNGYEKPMEIFPRRLHSRPFRPK